METHSITVEHTYRFNSIRRIIGLSHSKMYCKWYKYLDFSLKCLIQSHTYAHTARVNYEQVCVERISGYVTIQFDTTLDMTLVLDKHADTYKQEFSLIHETSGQAEIQNFDCNNLENLLVLKKKVCGYVPVSKQWDCAVCMRTKWSGKLRNCLQTFTHSHLITSQIGRRLQRLKINQSLYWIVPLNGRPMVYISLPFRCQFEEFIFTWN